MTDEQEIKKRILAKAEEMFSSFGFSRVTMDEVASGIGISKKTLYKHFVSKEQIVKELIYEKKCATGNYIECLISDESLEFIDKLKKLMAYLGEMQKNMRGPMIDDLIKNYPEIYNEIKSFRREKALNQFAELIQQGKDSGIFRKDVNSEIVTLLHVSAMHEILVPEVLETLPISADQVFSTIIKIVFEGILSEEGRKVYSDNHKNNESVEVK